MVEKDIRKSYKIMSYKAKDIYTKKYYDDNGNKTQSVNPLKYEEYNYKSSMSYSLELIELEKLIREMIKENKELKNTFIKGEFLYSIVNVSFDDGYTKYSRFYLSKKDKNKKEKEKNKDNKVYEIYYKKTGFENIEEIEKELKNKNYYVKDNELIAFKSSKEVGRIDFIDNNYSEYFKFNEIKNIYDLESKDNVNSKSLRMDLYDTGFLIRINDNLIINYKRYKRSSSEARNNNCLFIDDRLFKYMDNWSYFHLPPNDPDIKKLKVEIEAYKSLTLSSLEGTIEIDPKSILILPELEYCFNEPCTCIKVYKDDGVLKAKKDECKIVNKLFDGEGLLDESIFNSNPAYAARENSKKELIPTTGMVLLRNSFFKCCAFNTKLQDWLQDCKNNKIIENVEDFRKIGGITRAEEIEDIKLVVTYSSLKYVKFKNPGWDKFLCDYWLKNISSTFGVVKTDHPGKRFDGKLVETSYQFLNTLNLSKEQVLELSKDSIDYIKKMRKYEENGQEYINENDTSILDFYLSGEHFKYSSTQNSIEYPEDNEYDDTYNDEDEFEDEYDDEYDDEEELNESLRTEITKEDAEKAYTNLRNDVFHELIQINTNFKKTNLYYDFRNNLTNSLLKKINIKGRILIKGTNATLFGNGYEFLQYMVGKFDGKTSRIKPGYVMTKMFKKGEKICGVRYPHITMGNLYKAENVDDKEYNKYFNLTKEIICVNAMDENIQHRLNGCDYDSDFMTITNNKIIYNSINDNYNNFLVPFNDVPDTNPKSKKLYFIDNQIGNNRVGMVTNLSQHLNSIYWDMKSKGASKDKLDDLYNDICKLALLCGMEIDKAKRHYDIKVNKELNTIKAKWLIGNYKNRPLFLDKIKSEKNNNNYYQNESEETCNDESVDYNTTMSFVNKINIHFLKSDNAIDFIRLPNNKKKKGKKKIEEEYLINITPAASNVYEPKAVELEKLFDDCFKDIDTQRKKIKSTGNKDEYKMKKIEFNKYVRKKSFECYKDVFSKKLLSKYTVYYFCRNILEKYKGDRNKKQRNRYLWQLIYILYLSKKYENNKYNTLFDEIFKTNSIPKKLIRDNEGDECLFGYRFSYK